MFGLRPSAADPSRRLRGPPRRTAAQEHAGETPRADAAAARAAGRRRPARGAARDAGPVGARTRPLALSDVIAGPEPWTGMLLDPARPRPVPIGSLVRSMAPAPARHWLVWPDARLRPAHRTRGVRIRGVRGRLSGRARDRALRPRTRPRRP